MGGTDEGEESGPVLSASYVCPSVLGAFASNFFIFTIWRS